MATIRKQAQIAGQHLKVGNVESAKRIALSMVRSAQSARGLAMTVKELNAVGISIK